MAEYKSTAEHARELRAFLKTKGLSNRKVSVRSDSFSMGSSIDVTIKDPDVPIAMVEAAADEHSRIDRCEITGDILSGCNRYVHTSYSHEAEEALAARHLEAVEKAVAELDELGGRASSANVEIRGTGGALIGYGSGGFTVREPEGVGEGLTARVWDVRAAAKLLAVNRLAA